MRLTRPSTQGTGMRLSHLAKPSANRAVAFIFSRLRSVDGWVKRGHDENGPYKPTAVRYRHKSRGKAFPAPAPQPAQAAQPADIVGLAAAAS